jgi:hypothetical protein
MMRNAMPFTTPVKDGSIVYVGSTSSSSSAADSALLSATRITPMTGAVNTNNATILKHHATAIEKTQLLIEDMNRMNAYKSESKRLKEKIKRCKEKGDHAYLEMYEKLYDDH